MNVTKFRKSLLGSSGLAATTVVLMMQPAPALADCSVNNGITCSWSSTGNTGTPAPSSGAPSNGAGHDGGGGGNGSDWTLEIDGLNWVDDPVHLLSPINIVTFGGVGAQGSDATSGLDGKNGGSGGKGGDGGSIGVTTGPGMTGTTSSIASGMSLFTVGGVGGAGAFGNLGENTYNGVGAAGGNGGTMILDLDGKFPTNPINITNQSRALAIATQGGNGGGGRNWKAGLNENGPDAGAGGNGGTIDATLRGTFQGNGGGAYLASQGGTGGTGGEAEDWPGSSGGNGGAGGNAAHVNITVTPTAKLATFTNNDAGLTARSLGGTGGVGGEGPSGGTAGAGGNADNVSVILQGGIIQSYGETVSMGVLAQSLGGNGGDGGAASHGIIGPNGGAGSVGGTAGSVSVTGTGGVQITTGATNNNGDPTEYGYSPGILAQSVGGGGGGGGNSTGWFAVGGSGGNGVNGSTATVDVQAVIKTFGTNSDGIAVQSIGGGGGKGSDAKGSGVEVNMIIGGTGGGGGNGDAASARLQAGSAIETTGSHGHGILIQSVGGGGGAGGAAYSKSTNLLYGASMSLGGSGGAGGDGSTVGFVTGATTTNAGRITTSGSDAYGIIGQSIGGGGGIGGASTAISNTYSDDGYPGLSLSMAMGGTGGDGGSANSVTLDNSGLIATTGAGSVGIIGQSVGGGGGSGGDASSSSTATGGEVNISANLTFGGKAGSGNNGGIGTISNSGIILTTGESADGMLVQSIGGGGGNGGAGDGKSTASKGTSISASLTMGGKSAGGGDGQSVTATNAGSIITLGDSAFGVAAQSIGGGGGRGGGAAGSATGDYSATVNMGGSGGNGGNAGDADAINAESTVTVKNTKGSTIVTFGADANGIIAQSIGGGGGAGGKSASSISTKKSTNDGGNGDATGTASTLSSLATTFDGSGLAGLSGYAGLNGAVTAVNSLLGITTSPTSKLGDVEDDLDDTTQSKGDTDDDNESTSITIKVGVGGTGGSGGNAGAVVIQNDGEVATMGHHADAIVGMGIGGGGGKGGAASTASSDDNESGNLSVGGSGGNGGWGSTVNITNTGDVYTKGALSAGIVGQSIAGGGGIGGASASSVSASSKNSGDDDANDGAFKNLTVSVGGNGGGSYDSGQVTITNSGAISTAAHDSIGIIAQSITGGGGIVKTLATDLEGAGGTASAKGTDYDIQFKFGGSNGSTSQGSGLVNVTTTKGGAITTKGDNSYGILAQSIAGGGGLSIGGKPTGTGASNFFGSGTTQGSVINDGGNNSGLTVNVGDNITTSGTGAIGVYAQSIGGGGGIAGDTGQTEQFFGMSGMTHMKGSGGTIAVTLGTGVAISTTGDNAPAIFLQSIGGGGGRVTNDSGAYIGTAGGSGTGGTINATINGTVTATGYSSLGVFAQSQGDSTSNSPITVTVGSTGVISVGTNSVATGYNGTSAGIYIDHGGQSATTANVVTNNGQVLTYGSQRNAVAVYSNAGYTKVINNGTMAGDILLTNGGGSGCFTTNGSFNSGDTVNVGTCGVSNFGTINIKGALTGTTTITGNYGGTGKLVFDADFAGGTSDKLVVVGDANIAGTIAVMPKTMRSTPLTMVTATGTLTLDTALATTPSSHLFDYTVKTDGKTLTVTPKALFTAKASTLGANQKSVATNLQSVFDSGAAMDVGFGRMMAIVDDASYASALKSLSGQGLGAFGAFRFNSSRTFAANLFGGCNDLHFASKQTNGCGWSRVLINDTTQKAGSDTLGYNADAYALQIGGQTPLSDTFALTGSLAYESTKFHDGDGTARITGDALVGGLGLLFTPQRWELSAGIDAAYGWYKSQRSISLGVTEQAQARPEQSQFGGHLRAAYNLLPGASGFVRPFAEAHAIYVSNKGFNETGTSPFRLAVEGQSDTALIGVAGLEIGTVLPMSATTALRPFASAAVEFGSRRTWTTTARFADQPTSDSFDLKTAGPGTLARLAIGLDLLGAKNITLSVQYSPELGKDFTSHSGTARFTFAF